jgi:dihydrofolate reductase
MTPERKIIVSIAASADGFIARRDGGVDWLDRPRPKGDYGMAAFFRSIDTILWGRRTYDESLPRGGAGGFGLKAKNYVFTHRPPGQPAAGVEFVNEPVSDFARRLRAAPGKNIWIMGGGGLIASFLDAGQIDEFNISVVPTFIGEGVPLIAPQRRTVALKLLSSEQVQDGVVRLQYRVERRG